MLRQSVAGSQQAFQVNREQAASGKATDSVSVAFMELGVEDREPTVLKKANF